MDGKLIFYLGIILIVAIGGILVFTGSGYQDRSIRSDLGQVESRAERYHIEHGSYNIAGGEGFNETKDWLRYRDNLPRCSAKKHEDLDYEKPDEYQLRISGQSFMAWAALCSRGNGRLFYCVDSDGNKIETTANPANNSRGNNVCPQ